MGVPIYYPYHCHTYYSNIFTRNDSPASIDDYAKQMKARNIPVLCLSEHGNRSNIYEQADLCDKYSDENFKMKPIAAAECYFVPDRNPELKDGRNFHLIVIAKDNTGLEELNFMLSIANETGFYKKARVDFDLLSQLDYNHFLVTTACVSGPLSDEDQGVLMCSTLHEIFKENFYLEIQHHPQKIQLQHNAKILVLHKKYRWPLIYATDSHYINKEDKVQRQELLWAKKKAAKPDEDETKDDDFDLYLPTNEEAWRMMNAQNIFSKAQIEEAFENTHIIGTFDGVTFDKKRKFPVSRPDLTQEERNYLYQKMVCDGYIAQAGTPTPEEAAELRQEMNTIVDTNSADYFIGLHDLVQKGIENGGVMTTTSRGSACSFSTNYGLGFTSINRLKTPVKMYPARFISAEKLSSGSMPDIDTNVADQEPFARAGKEIFGEYGCLPMLAYGKLQTLSAFKMLASVRNIDFDIANEVSKQISTYELKRKHAIENNQDDPDYNVDDYVTLEQFIEPKYIDLVNDSKQFMQIITSLSPHPCAFLVYHKDLRREFGIIRQKPKKGSTEPVYTVYVDGATADAYGYCKIDLLTVTVVDIINKVFKRAGKKMLSANELIAESESNPGVYDIYKDGFTQCVNQFERPKTTQRAMQFKPKNTVELAAFVAAIRPGAKSLVDSFVSRSFHNYQIPAMDEMLKLNGATGVTGKSSYLFYDEQILSLAQAAGIEPSDAYLLIKAIKKKKLAKVESYKEKFIPGFTAYLIDKQNVDEELAKKTAGDVWAVILASASYLFCCAHAYAYGLDSLYGAYLKYMYPYEFYATVLNIYTEKGDKKKVSLLIEEMNRYKGIKLESARFGHDNNDWYIDKENSCISQSLASVKGIGQNVSNDLTAMKDMQFEYFIDLLFYILKNTSIKKNQVEVLIRIGYFSQFGKTKKLLTLTDEFYNGKNRITKSLKSFPARLEELRKVESETPDETLSIEETVQDENEYLGLCISYDKDAPENYYIVKDLDDKYGVNISIYSLQRGTSGTMRVLKNAYSKKKLEENTVFALKQWNLRPKMNYVNGQRIPSEEKESWLADYDIIASPPDRKKDKKECADAA